MEGWGNWPQMGKIQIKKLNKRLKKIKILIFSSIFQNSIRHNLSLHSRFMRIQNEGAGKSSWWVINPDAKPGRNPRRRANTMENASKVVMDKKRRGARKRVEQMVQQKGHPGPTSSSMAASMQGLFPEESADQLDMAGPSGAGPNFDTFRFAILIEILNILCKILGPEPSQLCP